jgi:hypothetical protein
MAYGLQYYFEFNDTVFPVTALWRIEIARKDYVGSAIQLPYMAENPLTINRTAEEESKLSVFVGSKATIRYIYDGTAGTPHPRVFKDIQEDTFLVSIYKNTVLNFKGFVKPDAGQYPWVNPPFGFEINATDYINGFKNTYIDLNDSGVFYYGFMTLGGFFRRTLMIAANYDGVLLKALFRLRYVADPNLYGSMFEKIFLHTDAFYDLDEGPDTVYVALTKLLKSLRCRLFFSAGSYWVQRIPDTWATYNGIDQLTNLSSSGSIESITNTHVTVPGDTYKIIDDSAIIRVAPAIYSQKTTYALKALNQLTNFKWDNLITSGPETGVPVGWNPTSAATVGVVTRHGTGTALDPFNMEVSGSTSGYSEYMVQTILNVNPGVYIRLDVKAGVYYTTGQRVRVQYGGYYMDGSGNWSDDPSTEIIVSGDKKTRLGTVSIVSKKLPDQGGPNFLVVGFKFVVAANDTEDPVPTGQVPRNYIYPVFLRIFANLVTSVEINTVNDKKYSNIPGPEEFTFLDMDDKNLSNCIFYRNGVGDVVPMPLNSWTDDNTADIRNIDYWAGRAILDEFNVSSNVIEVDILSNTLEFHQTIVLPTLDDGVRVVQISDNYDVKDGKHSIVAEQVFEKGYGTGTITYKSIAK